MSRQAELLARARILYYLVKYPDGLSLPDEDKRVIELYADLVGKKAAEETNELLKRNPLALIDSAMQRVQKNALDSGNGSFEYRIEQYRKHLAQTMNSLKTNAENISRETEVPREIVIEYEHENGFSLPVLESPVFEEISALTQELGISFSADSDTLKNEALENLETPIPGVKAELYYSPGAIQSRTQNILLESYSLSLTFDCKAVIESCNFLDLFPVNY